jgi:hypothetical protein
MKLLLSIILSLFSLLSHSQAVNWGNFQIPNVSRGIGFQGVNTLREFYLPVLDTFPLFDGTGKKIFPMRIGSITQRPQDTTLHNGIIYYWGGSNWTRVGSGGGNANNNYPTSLQFIDGILRLSRNELDTLDVNLDGRYQTSTQANALYSPIIHAHPISQVTGLQTILNNTFVDFTNNSDSTQIDFTRYDGSVKSLHITGSAGNYIETDSIFLAHVASSITQEDIDKWNNASNGNFTEINATTINTGSLSSSSLVSENEVEVNSVIYRSDGFFGTLYPLSLPGNKEWRLPKFTGSSIILPTSIRLNSVNYFADTTGQIDLGTIATTTTGTWTPTWTGFSTDPTFATSYVLNGKACTMQLRGITPGTSNATTFTVTLPFAGGNVSTQVFVILVMNSNTLQFGKMEIAAGSTTATVYPNAIGGAWTGTGNKSMYAAITYIIQ